jgi:hypothetical protein
MTEDELRQSDMEDESVHGVVNARELREILSSYEFFYDLSEPALEALAGAAERVFVRAGQRILEDGVPAYAAFIVEYGRLRIVTRRSHQTITLEEGRGELIGMISVLSQEPFDGEAFALRDSKLIRLPRKGTPSCPVGPGLGWISHADGVTTTYAWETRPTFVAQYAA